MIDYFEEVKRILTAEFIIKNKLFNSHRDTINLQDYYFFNGASFFVSLSQYDNYNLFEEIKQQQWLYRHDFDRSKSIKDFENKIYEYLKKGDKYEEIYLLYVN
jgi:sRNA-binding regulator protein Hfq